MCLGLLGANALRSTVATTRQRTNTHIQCAVILLLKEHRSKWQYNLLHKKSAASLSILLYVNALVAMDEHLSPSLSPSRVHHMEFGIVPNFIIRFHSWWSGRRRVHFIGIRYSQFFFMITHCTLIMILFSNEHILFFINNKNKNNMKWKRQEVNEKK